MRKLRTILMLAALLLVATAGWAQQREGRQRRGEGGREFGPPPGLILQALDLDGDGELSAEEIAKASESLKTLDKNKDGRLSREELRPQFGPGMGQGPGQGPEQGMGQMGPGPGMGPEGDMGPPPDRRGSPNDRRRGSDRNPPPDRWGDSDRRDTADRRDNSERRGSDERGNMNRGLALFQSEPQGKSEREKKILAVLDEMQQEQTGRTANVPKEDGRLLRVLAQSIGAKQIVELGTSTGYSGVWFGLALETTGGKLTTFEVDAERATTAKENFQKAGLSDRVAVIVGDAHKEVAQLKEPIDLVFLDADKEGYLDYLQKLLPLVRPGGLIVAHNMNAHQADPRYVKAITTNSELETVFVNLPGSGIGVTMKKP